MSQNNKLLYHLNIKKKHLKYIFFVFFFQSIFLIFISITAGLKPMLINRKTERYMFKNFLYMYEKYQLFFVNMKNFIVLI